VIEVHILRVFGNVEMKIRFGNDKGKRTGNQTGYRSRMDDITAAYLKVQDFNPRPGNKLSVGRFTARFLSPC
jgi:hypothetical protein